MKTAMQELIEYVDSIWSNGGWEETIKEKAKELLEKEKEHIIDAYNQGTLDGESSQINYPNYYNETFNR
jgi:hypothetical protein